MNRVGEKKERFLANLFSSSFQEQIGKVRSSCFVVSTEGAESAFKCYGNGLLFCFSDFYSSLILLF